ncbi:MAG: hypothetical protein ABSE86_12905 [Bryobacteraceae bacterium]|jgi:hypothetical protein
MNTNRLSVAAAIFLLAGAPASAHRLDEYLQATLISVEKDRVEAQMRLVPGVAVSSFVLTSMHANADGAISEAEQQAYAKRVLRDVSLKVDGVFLRPRLNSVEFPGVEEMKEGVGEIRIEFSAALPRGGGSRRLVFENHHQNRIGAYMVNVLVPRDRDIRVVAQNRNEQQSFYQLDYVQAGVSSSGAWGWLGMVGLLLSSRLVFLWRQRA